MAGIETYDLLRALPNKLLNSDGSITDFQGNTILPADNGRAETYRLSRAMANKFLNNTEEIKTYAEISVQLFMVVDSLPEEGESNKIYLVPGDNGYFDEYFWNPNSKWDKVGEVTIDLSNYPNKKEVADAIAVNSTSDRTYTDEQIRSNITNVLGGEY